MRESFVFHAEYVADLPEEYRPVFITYTVQYGLYGEEPALEKNTLEYALWVKIARRIDAEFEKYQRVSERRRKAAQSRYEKTETVEQTAGEKPAETDNGVEEKITKSQKKFEKPTVEEIADYCRERGSSVNAQTFYDFYESKGWKVGNARMKDWKASVRLWEQRRSTEQTGGHVKPGTMWGKENSIPDEIMSLI